MENVDCFEKYFLTIIFHKIFLRKIIFETYFLKNNFQKIFFRKIIFEKHFSKKNLFQKIFFNKFQKHFSKKFKPMSLGLPPKIHSKIMRKTLFKKFRKTLFRKKFCSYTPKYEGWREDFWIFGSKVP